MTNIIGKLILLSIAKKVTVFLIAKTYGFPRLYRRAMELNKKVLRNHPEAQGKVRELAQATFRMPGKLLQAWKAKFGSDANPSTAPGRRVGSEGQSARTTPGDRREDVPRRPS